MMFTVWREHRSRRRLRSVEELKLQSVRKTEEERRLPGLEDPLKHPRGGENQERVMEGGAQEQEQTRRAGRHLQM